MSVIRTTAKEVAVIENGRIVEHGDVFDVFTRPQHATTRAFVAGETGRALPKYLKARLTPEPSPTASAVLRILFRGPHATDPFYPSSLAISESTSTSCPGPSTRSPAGPSERW